jgi:Fic family protein
MEARLFELDAKMDALRPKMAGFPDRVQKDYQDRLDVSWIYHDHAMDGIVLSYSELKAAIDTRIISDVSLILTYEEVKNHKVAIDFIRQAVASGKPPAVDLDLVRKFYSILSPDAVEKGCPYRKENPMHRLYYHEIAPPEKIGYRMRKLGEWLESEEFAKLHPIAQSARLQFQLLAIYPWTKNSGKIARLLTNYILLSCDYLPSIVHYIERQRYYEILRHDNDGLINLIGESLENSIETTTQFLIELKGLRLKRAS